MLSPNLSIYIQNKHQKNSLFTKKFDNNHSKQTKIYTHTQTQRKPKTLHMTPETVGSRPVRDAAAHHRKYSTCLLNYP